MLVKTFRKNYFNQYLLIFILSIFLWMGTFISPEPIKSLSSYSFLYLYIYDLLLPFPLLTSVLAYLIVVFQGLFFNMLLIKHKLISNKTFLPMFVYIFVLSSSVQTITPVLLADVFILFALNNLLDCENISKSQYKIFNASAMVSIATFFHSLSVFYLIFIVSVIAIYKIYYWREWFTVILGYAFPQIIALLWCFLTDTTMSFIDSSLFDIFTFSFVFDFTDWKAVFLGLLLLLIFLVSIGAYLLNIMENMILYRKKSTIIACILLVAFVISLFVEVFPLQMQLYAIPFSFFIASYLLRNKNKEIIGDIILIMFIMVVFCNVYLV